MASPIADLIALQELDSAVQRESAEIASLPGLREQADARVRALEEKLQQERAGLDEAQKERRKLEGELEGARAKLGKYQDQLMQVKSNEAYRAMLKEMEIAKQDIAQHEERILERMLLSDDLEKDLAAGKKEFEAARVAIEKEKQELDRRETEAEKRRADLRRQREALAGRVPAAVLADYERVARGRSGVAVAEARDELCLGCRVKVRPQVYQEILAGQELHQCDSCGRFLYVRAEQDSAEAPGGSPPASPAGADDPRGDEPAA